MFRKLRDAYTNVLWNPFYVPGTKIESKKFDSVVSSIMAWILLFLLHLMSSVRSLNCDWSCFFYTNENIILSSTSFSIRGSFKELLYVMDLGVS